MIIEYLNLNFGIIFHINPDFHYINLLLISTINKIHL